MLMNLGSVLVHVTTVGAVLFVLGYGVLSPWYRSAIGRALMAMAVSLLLIFGLSSFTLIFGFFPWRPAARATVAAVAAFSVWAQFAVLITNQIMTRRSRRVDQVR